MAKTLNSIWMQLVAKSVMNERKFNN